MAELNDRALLAAGLDAHIPVDWPSGMYDDRVTRFFLDRLMESPQSVGWWAWYTVLVEGQDRTLIANVGFKGQPQDGSLEIGYGVLEEYRRRGFAREACAALITWAFREPLVERIEAKTTRDNRASQRVLAALRFEPIRKLQDEAHDVRYVRLRGSSAVAQPG